MLWSGCSRLGQSDGDVRGRQSHCQRVAPHFMTAGRHHTSLVRATGGARCGACPRSNCEFHMRRAFQALALRLTAQFCTSIQ
jgi:hypothetical protein